MGQSVVVPYDLNINNVSHAPIIGNNKGTIIDYIITDESLTINKTYVFETLSKTDHTATLSILCLTLTKKSTVGTKLVFDKTNLDIKTHAPLRKVYIRIEKPLFSLAQKFVSVTTRELQINKEDLLDKEIFDKLLNTRNQLNSNYKRNFKKFQKHLIESNSSSRKNGMLIMKLETSKEQQIKSTA